MAQCPNLYLIYVRHYSGHEDYYLDDQPTPPPIPQNIGQSQVIFPDNYYDTLDASYTPKKKFSSVPDSVRVNLNSVYNAEAVNCISTKVDQNQSAYMAAITWLYNQVNSDVSNVSTLVDNAINTGISELSSFIDSTINGYVGGLEIDYSSVGESLSSQFEGVITAITNSENETYDYLEKQQDYYFSQLADLAGNIHADIHDEVSSNSDGLLSNFTDLIDNVLSEITNVAGSPLEEFIDPFKDVFNLIGDIVDLNHLGISGLLEFLDFIVNDLFKPFKDFALDASEKTVNVVGHGLGEVSTGIDNIDIINERLKSGYYHSWDALETDLKEYGGKTGLMKFAVTLLQVVPMIYQLGQLLVSPTMMQLGNLATEHGRATILNEGILGSAYLRKKISLGGLIQEMGLRGYSDARIKTFVESLESYPDPDSIRQLFLRGNISNDYKNAVLSTYGLSQDAINKIESLWHILPPAQDLITMAVREVFTPDIAEKYGLFQDFPEDFAKWGKQIGLDDQWSKNYWGAHWQLPSALQGFEMFHRKEITYDELQDLLRALDYMPYWRDKLTKIAYRPIPRVDIRRIHDMGFIGDEELPGYYEAFGFSPEHAQLMAKWTIAYNADSEETPLGQNRALTKAAIEKGYRVGILSRDNAIIKLRNLGYSDTDADYIISLVEYNQQLDYAEDKTMELMKRVAKTTERAYELGTMSQDEAIYQLENAGYGTDEARALVSVIDMEHEIELKSGIINEVKKLYIQRTTDQTTTRQILTDYGFSQGEIDKLFNEMNVLRELRDRKPTPSEMRKIRDKGIIDISLWQEEMRGLGYNEKYVEWLRELDLSE